MFRNECRRVTLGMLLAAALLPQVASAQMLAGDDAARDRATHLLRRATFGPRPGDVDAVLALGVDEWLARQTTPAARPDPEVVERLAAFPAALLPPADLVARYGPDRTAAGDSAAAAAERRRRAMAGLTPQRVVTDAVHARLVRAVHGERQLEEVMTQFWFDHFNVFIGKGLDRYLVADYEQGAIRPFVFGRFVDMLAATAAHPAMLFYLDNWTSTAPSASRRGARDAPTRGGLNENYARELLELHTLGVDGGYTQEDVVAVARAFTGWTFNPGALRQGPAQPAPGMRARMLPAAGDVSFLFRVGVHDRDPKTVLGRELPAGRGIEDGHDVLVLLAAHPATARHLAGKLVRRFVSDDGDALLEAHLADVYLRTGGDLREVTLALFTHPRFHAPEFVLAKVRTPFELVAAALRLTGAEVRPARGILETLRAFDHLPYNAAEPTGYPVTRAEWVSTGAMLERMNFGLELAAGRMGVRPDATVLLGPGGGARDGTEAGLDTLVARLATSLLPGVETTALQATVAAEVRTAALEMPANPAAAPGGRARLGRDVAARALGLILGSPEFQRH